MVSFRTKKINSVPSLGEILSQAIQKHSLTIDQAARSTKISSDYLHYLESGNYDRLPGEVYAKNFLKVYAGLLHLDPAGLISRYLSEKNIYFKTRQISKNKIEQPVERLRRIHFLVTPKLIRNFVLAGLLIIFLAYLGFKVKGMFAPPWLDIYSPTQNLVTAENIIAISGQTQKETILKINGQKVLADNSGLFSETVVLQPGTNLIEITAQKKHGQPTKIYRQVVVTGQTN